MSERPLPAEASGGPRVPSRPVSRPPRLRPTTGPGATAGAAAPAAVGGRPGRLLRTASGALLAVVAVALGIVLLQAVRGGSAGDDVLLATGEGRAAPDGPDATGGAVATSNGSSASSPAAGPVAASATPETPASAQPQQPATPTPGQPVSAQPTPVGAPSAPAVPPVPTDVTVTVLAVGGSDAAEGTAEQLRAGGWGVRLVASYRGDPPGATTVFHVPGREQAAGLLAAQAGATAVRPAPASLSDSDLTLVVG